MVHNRTTETRPALVITPTSNRSLLVWLSVLLVGVLVFVPRVWGLADFFTLDEANSWVKRVDRFSEALAARDWAATVITGHPGVTVMWLGTLGRWAGQLVGIGDPGWGGGASYLGLLRLPVAIVNSLAVVAGYALLRRLFRADVALLAAILWATSPFLVAHGRLLHLDGLVTSFITLSLLLLLVAVQNAQCTMQKGTNFWSFCILHSAFCISGVCAGLALLTKAPSLVWLALAGLLMLFAEARTWRVVRAGGSPAVFAAIRSLLLRYLIWLGCAVIVVVVLWPALWVAPAATLGRVANEIIANGGQPHETGNYFAGQPVADPGPLLYPATVLWRTTPVTLIGLVLFVTTTVHAVRLKRRVITPQAAMFGLAFFVLAFSFVLSLEPKKFDRYLLPVWPALEIGAAIGWVSILDFGFWILDYRRRGAYGRSSFVVRPLCFVVCCLFLVGTLAVYHPYYLAYYNPLLGGSAVGQRMLLPGWGEGQEQVGAWLRSRPDIKKTAVYTWDPAALGPFVSASTDLRDLRRQDPRGHSGYAVLYIRNVVRQDDSGAIAYIRQTPPLYTLRLHGVEYASVHQLPFAFKEPIGATFGDGLHLRGFSQRLRDDTLTITPAWDVRATQPGGAFVFVHLLDSSGRVVAQSDQPLDKGAYPTWQAGQQFGDSIKLDVAQLPPGAYRVTLGVYNPATGMRFPLTAGTPLDAAVDGSDTLHLTNITHTS